MYRNLRFMTLAPVAPATTLSEFEGVLYLHLGTPWVQGAMHLTQPRKLVLEYVQRMMAWLLWKPLLPGADAHAVQLGLGAAAITRFTHGVLRLTQTTAVEINPAVIQVCRQCFRLPTNGSRLKVVPADAGDWAAVVEHAGCADVLCVDLYDHDAAGPVLDDEPFYTACHALLAEGGIMTVNLFGRRAAFDESLARIAGIFGTDQVWRLTPTREGNSIVVAARGIVVPDREELRRRADLIESSYGLPARKWLKLVRPYKA